MVVQSEGRARFPAYGSKGGGFKFLDSLLSLSGRLGLFFPGNHMSWKQIKNLLETTKINLKNPGLQLLISWAPSGQGKHYW